MRQLLYDHKKWNGYTPVKLNRLDKIVSREHYYGANRMCIFGLWTMCGMFVPLWIALMLLRISPLISLIGCVIVGIIGEIVYQNSCDKIDYDYLVSKNQQLNLFKDCGMSYIN